jgi:acyl-CoA thioesterase I
LKSSPPLQFCPPITSVQRIDARSLLRLRSLQPLTFAVMGKVSAFVIAIATLLVLDSWHCAAMPLPIKILPLGDSITQGGRADRPEYTYRLPLQRLLVGAGVNFDFVGSMNTGLQPAAVWAEVAPGIPFDPDHEGHYGWKTAAVRDQLEKWLLLYNPPDMALIHLGTNDQDVARNATSPSAAKAQFTRAIVQPLEDMIGMLRCRNPRIVVLVGHLNFNDGPAIQIRPLVEAMAARLSTQESPVITVHHYRGFMAEPGPDSDTFDWAHPNPRGQSKMAITWFDAMRPYLPR